MKAIIFATLFNLALSTAAFAGIDTTQSDYDGVLGAISLKNACVTATEVKTKRDVRVCDVALVPVTYVGNNEDLTYTVWKCNKWITKPLSVKRAFKRTVCVDSVLDADGNLICNEYGQIDDVIPKAIPVRNVKDAVGTKSNWPGLPAVVTLPEC